MTDAVATAGVGRPRRWWLALLLNLLIFPSGYAYVGARKLAGAMVVLAIIAAVGLLAWSVLFPPGVYRWPLNNMYGGAIALAIGFALHAAWLSRRAAPVTGSVWAHGAIYLAFYLAVLGAVLGLRMLAPVSTYVIVSSSMAPSFRSGDIVAVGSPRALCGPTRPQAGDVVVYRQPGRGSISVMQRVVAGPGQTVAMADGRLSIDGASVRTVRTATLEDPIPGTPVSRSATKMRETLANGVSYETLDLGPGGDLDTMTSRRLGPDQWFILGDNRDNALDSRIVGPIGADQICGVAQRILQSEDKSRVGAKP